MKPDCRLKMKTTWTIRSLFPFIIQRTSLFLLPLLLGISVALTQPALAQSREEVYRQVQQRQQQALQALQQRRAAIPQQMNSHTLPHGGRSRSYDIFIPPTYNKQYSYPMIIVLHGGGGNAEVSERMTKFMPWAVSKEFVLVHPEGTGRLRSMLTWNAGNCCAYAFDERVDDVDFIRSLIAHISKEVSIDPARIYVTGMSNGAKLAYRLGCQLSDTIAAIAPVAGSMEEPDCAPGDSVAVMAFHGTADQHVLYEGGEPKKQVDRLPRVDNSVKQSVGFWVNHNQCSPLPHSTQTRSVRRDQYTECLNGADVILYTIEGGGHAWPGGAKGWVGGDAPSAEVDATKEIVNFFLTHPKK